MPTNREGFHTVGSIYAAGASLVFFRRQRMGISMSTLKSRVPFFICCILLVSLFVVVAASPAEAAELGNDEFTSADFDISVPRDQKQLIQLEDGSIAELGIRCLGGIAPLWDSYYPNAAGDWEIYYNSPIINRRFYITISNHRITRAHSASYTTFLCTVSSESFTWNSTVATYRLGIDALGGMGSTVAVLQAIMEGTTLHTYAN